MAPKGISTTWIEAEHTPFIEKYKFHGIYLGFMGFYVELVGFMGIIYGLNAYWIYGEIYGNIGIYF